MSIPIYQNTTAPNREKLAHFYNAFEHVSEHGSVQATINAAVISGRDVWLEPNTTYSIDTTLLIENVRGLVIRGNSATLQATSDLSVLMDMNGVADCAIHDLNLTTQGGASSAYTVTDMLRVRWDGVVARSTTRNLFEHVYINGRFVNGVRIGQANNTLQEDNSLWQTVTISGGWSSGETTLWQRGFIVGTGQHANNMLHNFRNCSTYFNRIHYEIAACRYVSISGNGTGAEIDVSSNATRAINMSMYRSEDAGMLFKADASGATYPMLMAIRDCGFHPGANLNANARWIEVNYGGSLILENIAVQPVPDAQTAIVYGTGLQKTLYIRAHGLAIEGTTPASMFDVTGATIDQFGCFEIDNSGAMV